MNTKKEVKGIHRAKLWQIAGFALNNSATNLYLFFMNYIAYYMTGYVGVGVVTASTFITAMRVWDGVTDPFIGYLVDKTNTKFGKNRPFMLIGNILLMVSSFLMIRVTHNLPWAVRFLFFIIIYLIYIIGYTFQGVATKSAQSCLTNDPVQRPLFSIFDGIYITIIFTLLPILFTGYLVPKYGGFNEAFFFEAWCFVAPTAFFLTLLAIVSIAGKDREEYFGIGKPVRVGFRDYWEVLKNNRAIQMLVVSAGTDKLASQSQGNSTVGIIIYAILCGNYALNGVAAGYTSIPTMLFLVFGVGLIATRLGQKRALVVGSIGALLCCILQILLFEFGNPASMSFPGMDSFQGWNFFTVAFLALWISMKGFLGISGNIVIPMTADCADYEVYRSRCYVPGLMGTLFSFVDKLISSLATTIVGLLCASIGFVETLPDVDTPYSPSLKFIGLFCMYGLTIIGLICNLIAMKFYPLTREKMEEIQDEIARIKEKVKEEEQREGN